MAEGSPNTNIYVHLDTERLGEYNHTLARLIELHQINGDPAVFDLVIAYLVRAATKVPGNPELRDYLSEDRVKNLYQDFLRGASNHEGATHVIKYGLGDKVNEVLRDLPELERDMLKTWAVVQPEIIDEYIRHGLSMDDPTRSVPGTNLRTHPWSKKAHLYLQEQIMGFISTDEDAIGSRRQRLISPMHLNAATAWFVETVLAYGEKYFSGEGLPFTSSDNIDFFKYNIAMLAFLYGYFDEHHPNGLRNKLLLKNYIDPRWGIDIPEVDQPELTTKRLRQPEYISQQRQKGMQLLQDFWRHFFIVRWMAQARTGTNRFNALAPDDRMAADAQLGIDRRISDTHSGAVAAAQRVMAKSDSSAGYRDLLAEHQRNQEQVERQAQQAQQKLLETAQAMTGAYSGNEVRWHRPQAGLEASFSRLKQGADVVFARFNQLVTELPKSPMVTTEEVEILQYMAGQLIEVVDSLGMETGKTNLIE